MAAGRKNNSVSEVKNQANGVEKGGTATLPPPLLAPQKPRRPVRGDAVSRALSMLAFQIRSQALRCRPANSPSFMAKAAASTTAVDFTNLEDFLNMVANNISALTTANQSTEPAASAKAWFVNFGGAQPAHVNTWLGANLESGSESSNYTLANNADLYWESLATTLWDFATSEMIPDDGDALESYRWFRGQMNNVVSPGTERPSTTYPPRPVKDFVKTQLPQL